MFTANGALACVGVACVRSRVVISAYLDGPLYKRLLSKYRMNYF